MRFYEIIKWEKTLGSFGKVKNYGTCIDWDIKLP